MNTVITIREEKPEDFTAIRRVNEIAFGQSAEANIVDKLRKDSEEFISLVAVDRDNVVGHILFSPAIIEGTGDTIKGMGLAPMAVLPGLQNQGIGSALVKKGLSVLRERNYPFVIVLGHPDYYPRFGFEPASKYGIKSQWETVPDEAFMIIVFDAAIADGVSGIARYRDEFNEAM